MASIGWLHLSDLHQGLKDQDWLWPSVKERFFEDLERLHRNTGPWDLVLFTGDLTQQGSAEEFDRLTTTLEALWRHLDRLGSRPFLVAVPGNHDLVRPDPRRAVVKVMRQWHEDRDLRDQLLTEPGSEVRQLIEDAFTPFTNWLSAWAREHPAPIGVTVQRGVLPGDASVLVEKE
ncbi:MAG TPA: metallophosphoesterase, partial [Candidatus Nanopelagicales bacterium]|nr:metallophosphoesterase [Candidatus Nanopelagicales bacterium]